MRAQRIFYDKAVLADGSIVEMTIWRLPRASVERPHGLKYSLFYGRDGKRIVGYDNERGKGDHKHLGEVETVYHFVSVEQMVADFLADVERANGGQHEQD
jgi:hypothetical protein